jgi:YD repeat-containing protein
MDSLRYGYTYAVDPVDGKLKLVNNKLNHVKDTVAKGRFTEDIDNQGDDNYDYTQIGEMKADKAEGIDTIKWNVYGKVDEVFFSQASGKHNLKFRYDALGNRVAKIANNKITYYWRDAQGNTLAMETQNTGAPSGAECQTTSANTIEYSIYGSSRLGVYHDTLNYNTTILSSYGQYLNTKTLRHYELTNHLENVMAVVSDVKYRDAAPSPIFML